MKQQSLCRKRIIPALARPGMYAGQQGERSKLEWQADAVIALNDGQPGVNMDAGQSWLSDPHSFKGPM